jgi:integrase
MEIAHLRAEDISRLPSAKLRIHGKGGKWRLVDLPFGLLGELERDFPPVGYLFERMDGRSGPPTAMRVSERINTFLHKDCGIEEYTAHDLRHRFGTRLYGETRDLLLVAELMGHASIETTRGYVQLVGSDRAAAAVQAISVLDGGLGETSWPPQRRDPP